MNYNLIDESWIPVLWRDGRTDGQRDRVHIVRAFERANLIRQIAFASPLDLFAVHRFMLTLLYWKAPLAGGVEEVRKALLREERVPESVLDGINEGRHRWGSAPSLRRARTRAPRTSPALRARRLTP